MLWQDFDSQLFWPILISKNVDFMYSTEEQQWDDLFFFFQTKLNQETPEAFPVRLEIF